MDFSQEIRRRTLSKVELEVLMFFESRKVELRGIQSNSYSGYSPNVMQRTKLE